jgi:hypothetical protein
MLGITGAHRTGKSTLAKAFAEKTGIPFVQTSASGVFADMGLDAKVDYPLDIRLDIQREILRRFVIEYGKPKAGVFITDRTPIDLMAYTLADVQRESTTPAQADAIVRYLEDCTFATNRFFSTLVVVQPGIALVEEPGKAPANPAYVEHIHNLIMGLVVGEGIQAHHFYVPKRLVDLEKRVQCLEFSIGRTAEKHVAYLEQLKASGQELVIH